MSDSQEETKKRQRFEAKLPDYGEDRVPQTLIGRRQTINDVVYMPPIGSENADIMFVSPCVLEEEMDDYMHKPALFKGVPANLLRRAAMKGGIKIEDQWYTTLCKYALPRNYKLKPKAADINRCAHLLEAEIERVKPKIVVCMGKVVFDYFFDIKLKERDIRGGWFTVEGRDFVLYLTDPIHLPVSKPNHLEKLYTDMREIRTQLDSMLGHPAPKVPLEYEKIESVEGVKEWAQRMGVEGRKLFAVDCEWGEGQDVWTGKLRSIQFCWSPGKACFIQFYDESGREIDGGLEAAARSLQSLLNKPDIRYIGHNWYQDALWMKHILGLQVRKRCVFDTMFAIQTFDEHADLKLERASVRWTDLGRYDIDLILWKKRNAKKFDEKRAYAQIPTNILFPYACKDVDAPMRLYPVLMKELIRDETAKYFFDIRMPFVTDCFRHMTENGIPADKGDLAEMRKGYKMAKELSLGMLRDEIDKEAQGLLLEKLMELNPDTGAGAYLTLRPMRDDGETGFDQALEFMKTFFGYDFTKALPHLEHWWSAKSFNPNASVQKAKMLFQVKGFTPIKSTASDGMPSVSWEKVMNLTPGEQANYTPCVDKDVLQIYADAGDNVSLYLVEYNAINQVTKNFLKGEDDGLEQYVHEDGFIHSSFLTTESNRPKSRSPNILNLNKFVGDNIVNGFERVKTWLKERHGVDDLGTAYTLFLEDCTSLGLSRDDLPDQFEEPKPLRWAFKAHDGYVFREVDYKTAEVFSIAYLAGDTQLIKALTEPDMQFVMVRGEKDHEPEPRRVCYIQSNTDITEDKQDPDLLIAMDHPDILRDENGEPLRPLRDVHWEMAENRNFMNEPREKLDKDIHRGAGKAGNFQIPYQCSPGLLERKVEISTKKKPPEGTGEKIILAYEQTKPRCKLFIDACCGLPENPGYYKSPTGFKRHFHVHALGSGIGDWVRDRSLTPQQREASNIPMQSLVADTLARACIMLVNHFEDGLESEFETPTSSVVCPLYDAMYVYYKAHDKDEVAGLLTETMRDKNAWDLPGGRLKFELDFSEPCLRWSCKPTEEEQKLIEKWEQIIPQI